MAHPTARAYGHWAFQYRRTWRASIFSSFLSPVLYLAAMGVMLGGFVDRAGSGGGAAGGRLGVGYLVFLAPGLLAATAMQAAAAESTWSVMGAMKWVKTYHAMHATPLRPGDIAVGHMLWVATRVTMVSAVYLAVMAMFGAVQSWQALLAVPAALLCGMSFATPIMAFSASRESDAGFNVLFRFIVVPMFLFSGTFFPITQLPEALRWLAYLTPLWHGVDLCRTITLGSAGAGMTALHVGYLCAWALVGGWLALRVFHRRLNR